jgi:hypothetical protein
MTGAGAEAADPRTRRDSLALAVLSGLISLVAVWLYHQRGEILLNGDAVAHINIARRVFDSQTPGLFELGTVWLPLPHLLDMPFVANDWLWRTGLGGSIPSMVAYIAGALGLFRLVRGFASRLAGWIAAAIYTLNPNLIYLQSTAMTEPLYLALFIWTTVFFSEFLREAKDQPVRARRSLERLAFVLSAAILVRYDAWFLAAWLTAALAAYLLRAGRLTRPIWRGMVNFLLFTWLTAVLWLAYNHSNYGNALEFANGQYSARAIQLRSRTATMPTYPGENSLRTASLYFLKVSRMNLGEGLFQYALLPAAFVALLATIYFSRRFWPCLLLWIPTVFYAISVAWGSVPVYVPDWWPFSYYNARYGLEMLPATAVFVALGYQMLSGVLPRRMVAALACALVAIAYWSIWLHTPICLREARVNGRDRLEFDQRLAEALRKLPASSTLMMDSSVHPGALELAGIRLRRVLRESNPPYWEIALTQPARSADYVVAIDHDDLKRAVGLFGAGLQPVATVGTSPGLRATIYQSVHR